MNYLFTYKIFIIPLYISGLEGCRNGTDCKMQTNIRLYSLFYERSRLHAEVGKINGKRLLRIAELAKSEPRMKFTSLAHLLNKQSLVQCHHELPNKKATGINGTTKEQYSETLEENIGDLVSRLKSKSYHPAPVRRMYILKLFKHWEIGIKPTAE